MTSSGRRMPPLPTFVAAAAVLVVCLTTAAAAFGQRYADRNALMTDDAPPDATEAYDYDDYDGYGEEDPYGFRVVEDRDVFKWNVDQFPHPVNTPRFCNRMRPSHVCDPDLVLRREEADLLDESIDALYRSTPCICDRCDGKEGGIVVGIALLKHLHHPYHMHHAKVIRSFTEALRARWKLGRCDNDVLIVVATADRLSYTDVGLATSAHLSVHSAHRIFLEHRAHFSASNFSEGLADILRGYRDATLHMLPPDEGSSVGAADVVKLVAGIVGGVLILGALLFVVVLIYGRWKQRLPPTQRDAASAAEVKEPDTASSGWLSKKDIKVLFGPDNYQRCGTDDKREEEEVELDFTLATPEDREVPERTPLTEVTDDNDSPPDTGQGVADAFAPSPVRNNNNVLVTNM